MNKPGSTWRNKIHPDQEFVAITEHGLERYTPRLQSPAVKELTRRGADQLHRLCVNGHHAIPVRRFVRKKDGSDDKQFFVDRKRSYQWKTKSCGHAACVGDFNHQDPTKTVLPWQNHAEHDRKAAIARALAADLSQEEAEERGRRAAKLCEQRHKDVLESKEEIEAHILGFRRERGGIYEHYRGAYSHSFWDEETRFSGFDTAIDIDDGVCSHTGTQKLHEEDMRLVWAELERLGLDRYSWVNSSHGGKGYHVRIQHERIPSWKRSLLGRLVRDAALGHRPYGPWVEVFPKQHEYQKKVLQGLGYGNLLGLPLNANLISQGRTAITDPKTGHRITSLLESVEFLEKQEMAPAEVIDAALRAYGYDASDPKKALKGEPGLIWDDGSLVVPVKGERPTSDKVRSIGNREDPLLEEVHARGVGLFQILDAAGTKLGKSNHSTCPVHQGTNSQQFHVFKGGDGLLTAKCHGDCNKAWKNPFALYQAIHKCSWGEAREAVGAMAGIKDPGDEKWRQKSRFEKYHASRWEHVYNWVGERVNTLHPAEHQRFLRAMVNTLNRLNEDVQVVDPEEIACSIFHHDTGLLDVEVFFDDVVVPSLKRLQLQKEQRKKGIQKSSGVPGISYLRQKFGAVCMIELIDAIMADTQFKLEWGRAARAVIGCPLIRNNERNRKLVWQMHHDAREREEDLLLLTAVAGDKEIPDTLDDVQISELKQIAKVDRYVSRQAGRLAVCSITKEQAFNDLTGKMLWSTWKRCGSRNCPKCGGLHYSTMYKALIRKWQHHKGPIWVAESRGLTRAQVDEVRRGLSDLGGIAQRVLFTGYKSDGHVVTTFSATKDQQGYCNSGQVIGGVGRDQRSEFKFDTVEEAAAYAVSTMFGLTAYLFDMIEAQNVHEVECELGFLKHRRLVSKTRESLGSATVEDVKSIRQEEIAKLHEGDGIDDNVLVGSNQDEMAEADAEAAGLQIDRDGDVFEIGAQISYRLVTRLNETIAVSDNPFSIDNVVGFYRFNPVLKNAESLLRRQKVSEIQAKEDVFTWNPGVAA